MKRIRHYLPFLLWMLTGSKPRFLTMSSYDIMANQLVFERPKSSEILEKRKTTNWNLRISSHFESQMIWSFRWRIKRKMRMNPKMDWLQSYRLWETILNLIYAFHWVRC